MRIRSFIVAYALVLAILLFADRRPHPAQQDRYSRVVDLTDGQNSAATNTSARRDSRTLIIAPDALIPGTWTADQIPPERLIAPLVVMDLNVSPPAQLSLDDVAAWETQHGVVPQGAIVAIRRASPNRTTPPAPAHSIPSQTFPITPAAAQFLMDARYTTGFAVEALADFGSDRTLARQIALHGNYVVEGISGVAALPAAGSLIIVAPARNLHTGLAPVRALAMVR